MVRSGIDKNDPASRKTKSTAKETASQTLPVNNSPPVISVRDSAQSLAAWFKLNRRDLPWRLDLEGATDGMLVGDSEPIPRRDPYRTWISEIMLQQTQVSTVVDYFKRWVARFPDVAALAGAREQDVLEAWAGLGYYSRARNLLVTAVQVMADHGGRFPWRREDLLALKGVGDYTAGAIASLAFNRPEPILDGNLVRVFSRLYGLAFLPDTGAGKETYWKWSRAWVESHEPALVNEGLMELGATLCTPKQPDCGACPLAKTCQAFAAGTQGRFPPAKPRKETLEISGFAVVARRGGEALLYRPRKPELLAGLMTFPIFPVGNLTELKSAWARLLPGSPPPTFRPRAVTVTHSITHHHFKLRLVEAGFPEAETTLPKSKASNVPSQAATFPSQGFPLPEGFAWLPESDLEKVLVSSLPRKIWKAFN